MVNMGVDLRPRILDVRLGNATALVGKIPA